MKNKRKHQKESKKEESSCNTKKTAGYCCYCGINMQRVFIGAIIISIFEAILAWITCGHLFNWIYEIEPIGIWKITKSPPGLSFYTLAFLLNTAFVFVYAFLHKGIPSNNKCSKGIIFGLCIWSIGMLPGILVTYFFMAIAPAVILYWIISGFVKLFLKGLITAVIYKE